MNAKFLTLIVLLALFIGIKSCNNSSATNEPAAGNEANPKMENTSRNRASETASHQVGNRNQNKKIAKSSQEVPEETDDEPTLEISSPLLAAAIPKEKILKREGYTVSYNVQNREPNYVAWLLTPERLRGNAKRSNTFYEDPELTADEQSLLSDYYNSGYDRGHMCPAADNKWSLTAMIESFYLSNVCPQIHSLNSGDWNELESFCRNRVKHKHENIYIIAGPIYTGHEARYLRRKRRVRIPDKFFKALLCLDQGKEKGIAFVYDNQPQQNPVDHYATTIDDVEQQTGYDLFNKVPLPLQTRLEAQSSTKEWE